MELRHVDDVIARLQCVLEASEAFVVKHLGEHMPEDLNVVQVMVLYRLYKRGELRSGEIHQYCYSGQNISYNLQTLFEGKYVMRVRRQGNKSLHYYRATEKGGKLSRKVESILKTLEKGFEHLFTRPDAMEFLTRTELMALTFEPVPKPEKISA